MPFDVHYFYLLVLLSEKIHTQVQVQCSYSPRKDNSFNDSIVTNSLEHTQMAVTNLKGFYSQFKHKLDPLIRDICLVLPNNSEVSLGNCSIC